MKYGIICHKNNKENIMVATKQEKVTIIIPSEIKERVMELKRDLKVSMNTIYNEAIAEYIKKQQKEKLKKEAKEMLKEYEENVEIKELANFAGEVVEY